jgi:hypothetical protein
MSGNLLGGDLCTRFAIACWTKCALCARWIATRIPKGLSEFIDLVPGARLLGFGSDVRYPEMIWGHLEMARSCIADVLAAKVERDFLSEEVALGLVHKMLHDNAIELYGLG